MAQSLNIQTGMKNPILRTVSTPVTEFKVELRQLVNNMKLTLTEEKNGIGLAAPQVGINQQVVLCKFAKNREVTVLVNPQIIWHSEKTDFQEEGCLSLPGVWAKVERFLNVKVKFQDIRGKSLILALSGIDARLVQHELDHLQAILFLDRAQGELVVDQNTDLKSLDL
ncbi:MAG TPA: peptide deformylase [Candidatus Gracilibacteria bacterium]|nr:peptide deformylase [Candidatus Gracilibacteria bacterium]